MKIKFNKFERVAGLFVLAAIFGGIAASVGVAIKKGWFEAKIHLETTLETADGVRVGTQVQMAGLRAGSVTEVDLRSANEVRVRFEISEKFHEKVREDSVVRVIRPFIIGEKVLDVSVGTETFKVVSERGSLRSEATADVMDLISGRTLGPHLATMGKMMENLRFVAEALLDPERSKAIVRMFDEISPLLKSASQLTKEGVSLLQDVNKKKKLVRILDNVVAMTDEVIRVLPTLQKESPQLAADLSKIARNMAVLTDELQKTLPVLQQVGPELPRTSRRAIEALDETVVTLKALQKSFLLRGNVKEVRDEEALRGRQPASSAPVPATAPVSAPAPATDGGR